MKDFVYLDTDAISSISAQLFEGNILELIDEHTENKGENITDSYGTDEKNTKGAKGSVPGFGLDGKKENQTSERKSIEFLNNETFKIGVKKAYDDFLYNKMISELRKRKLIKNDSNSNLYDFIELEGDFEFYDTKTIGAFFGSDILQRIVFMDGDKLKLPTLEEIRKTKDIAYKVIKGNKPINKTNFTNIQEAQDYINMTSNINIFGLMKDLTNHLMGYLEDKIILINKNKIIIGSRENLRVYPETLTLVSDLKLSGLVRLMQVGTSINEISNLLKDNPNKVQEKIIKIGVSKMVILILQPLLGLNENTNYEIVHPIGFEFLKMPR